MTTENQQSIGRLLDTKEASKYLGLPPEALDQFVTEHTEGATDDRR